MRVTVDQVMSWHPCEEYSRSRLEKLCAGRKYIYHRTLARLDIPPRDKLWALIALLPERAQHELACDFSESMLHLVEDGEERPRNAIETKRKWLRGEATDEELAASRDASRAASWAASGVTSRDASRASSWAASWAASRDAFDAAFNAASEASSCAASEASSCAASEAAAYQNYIDMTVSKIETEVAS